MKFKNAVSDTILTVNQQKFAKLVEITDKHFVYDISFEINPNEAALKNNSFNGNVFLYESKKISKEPILNTDKLQPNKETKLINQTAKLANETIINNLLSLHSTRKRNIFENDKKILLTKKFSLFDFMSLQEIEDSKRNRFSKRIETIILTPIQENNSSVKEAQPNYSSNINSDSIVVSELMKKSIQLNIDPVKLLEKTKGIKSLEKVRSGSFVNYNTLNLLQKSIISQNQFNPSVSDQTITAKKINQIVSTIKVSFLFEIEKTKLKNFNELYFEIELYDENSRPSITKEIVFNHKKEYDVFTSPKQAPKIISAVRNSNEKIVVYLKQMDKMATDIVLYYKETDAKKQQYFFLGKYPLRQVDGEKKIEINKLLSKKILLRAFAEFDNSKKGLLFDSVILEASKKSYSMENQKKNTIDILWAYKINGDNTVTVDCTVFDEAVRQILIYKQNNKSQQKTLIFGPKKPENNFLSFKDTEIEKNAFINYSVKLIKKDGTIIDGTNELLVHNKEIKTNILTTQITEQTNTVNSEILNVEYKLNTIIEKQNLDLIIENFKQQGIYDFFKEEFSTNDFSNTFAYRVIRRNEQTGDEEDFGILPTSNFNDNVLYKKAGIKPLQTGCSYMYSVYTYIRKPNTLIPSLVVTKPYGKTEYSFQPYFAFHPFTLKYGTLLTENSLKEQHSETDYSFGPTAEIIEVKADFSKSIPLIKDSISTNINKALNMVSWTVDGALDQIDSFIVFLNQLGDKKIVGACHNVSDTNTFQFFDELTDNEVGEVGYSIVPIYFDYSLGQEILTNTIII